MTTEATAACPRCGGAHDPFATPAACPYVKAVEWHESGDGGLFISRVEFLTPTDFGPAVPTPSDGDAAAADYPRNMPMK